MPKFFAVLAGAALALSLASCASSSDPKMAVPEKPPVDVIHADPTLYANTYGSYTFRIGGGTVWCTINPEPSYAVCEQNGPDVQYKLPTTPAGCDYAYGYQARLWAVQPSQGKIAEFMCSSGLYADPTGASDLPNNNEITVGTITCYAADKVARCDNATGQYIALGSTVYGFGNN